MGGWEVIKSTQFIPGGAPRRYDASANRSFHADADRVGTGGCRGEMWVLLAEGRLVRMFWEDLGLVCLVIRAARQSEQWNNKVITEHVQH